MLANDAQRLFGAPFRFEIAKVQAKALATLFERTRAEYGKADQFMPERHSERHRHTGGAEIDDIQTNAVRLVVVRWRVHECTPSFIRTRFLVLSLPTARSGGRLAMPLTAVRECVRPSCNVCRLGSLGQSV